MASSGSGSRVEASATAQQPQAEQESDLKACCFVAAMPVIFAIIVLVTTLALPTDYPTYSVSVSGVEGLDPAALARPTLSPVLNLTVHINKGGGCVRGLSTAVVSYNDAFLGKASLPEFCARGRKEAEQGITMWGQDVAVPRFLREGLAAEMAVGEAMFDVQLMMPATHMRLCCYDQLLTCKAKIDGGLSRCHYQGTKATPGQK